MSGHLKIFVAPKHHRLDMVSIIDLCNPHMPKLALLRDRHFCWKSEISDTLFLLYNFHVFPNFWKNYV